jgi:HD-like signal output (HDOD) protein
LRRHSSIAAIAAGALAREIGVAEGVAFTTALLHDLGKLALAIAEPAKYVALLHRCKLTGDSISKLEQQTFGFTHSDLGWRLMTLTAGNS